MRRTTLPTTDPRPSPVHDRRRGRLRALLAGTALSVAVVVAAPLGAARAATAAPSPSKPSSTAWKGFPQQLVTDLATSRPFDLGALAKAGRPVLVWFWAPS